MNARISELTKRVAKRFIAGAILAIAIVAPAFAFDLGLYVYAVATAAYAVLLSPIWAQRHTIREIDRLMKERDAYIETTAGAGALARMRAASKRGFRRMWQLLAFMLAWIAVVLPMMLLDAPDTPRAVIAWVGSAVTVGAVIDIVRLAVVEWRAGKEAKPYADGMPFADAS